MSDPAPLVIDFSVRDGVGILSPRGRLVAETRHELAAALRSWEADGPTRVVVLLRRLEYLDSAGMAALIGAWKAVRERGGDLVLAEINPDVRSIFRIASIEKILRVFPTLAEAERAVREAPVPPPRAAGADPEAEGEGESDGESESAAKE